ncbi:YHS domain-containing (seleno)protein [Albidovulum sp.]
MTITRRALLLCGLAVPVAGTILRPALAREPAVFAPDGHALSGYDPVAYFTEGRPVPGRADQALMWEGATWFFASAENRETFEMDPTRYSPRYGGYCAYAMSQRSLESADPQAFTIWNGRLYVTHSLEIREIWRQDIPGHVARADANWPAILGQM